MEGRALADAFNSRMGHVQITLDNLLSNVQQGISERDPNDHKLSQLYKAIEDNDIQQVSSLASEAGAKIFINRRLGVRQAGFNAHHMQLTPLGLCCLDRQNETAKVLMDAGADLNMAYGSLGATALMTSSHLGNVDMVRMLLDAGADPSARDSQGCNSLTYAATGKCTFEIIRMLIEARAELNCKNPFGFTALHVTSGMGMDNAVSLLLSAGADPNLHTDFGHTPLHLAVTGKKARIDQINKLGYMESLEKPIVQDIAQYGFEEWARIRQMDLGIELPKRKQSCPDGKSRQNFFKHREKSNRDSGVFYGSDEDETDAVPVRGRASARAGVKDAKNRVSDNKSPPRSVGNASSLFSCASSGGGRRRSRSAEARNKLKRRSRLMELENFLRADMDADQASTEVEKLSRKYTNVVKMLLASSCDTTVVDTYNWTALDYAVLSDDPELTDVLIAAGGDPLRTARQFALTDLYFAIKAGNKKDVRALLKDNLDVSVCFHYQMVRALDGSDNENDDCSTGSSERPDAGLTPLTLCARVDNTDLVKMMLKSGANVNQSSEHGEFPVAEGVINGNLKTVECLMKAGCDLNLQTDAYNGASPLILAARYRHRKIAEMLIKKGATLDLTNKGGKTALKMAVEVGDQRVADLLRSHTSSHVAKDLASLKQWFDKECPKTEDHADDFDPTAQSEVTLRQPSQYMRNSWYPRGQRPRSAIEPMVSDLFQSRLSNRVDIIIPRRPRERTMSCDLSHVEIPSYNSQRNFTKSGDVDASGDFFHASQPDIVKTTVTSPKPINLSPSDTFSGDMSVIQEVTLEYDSDTQCNENDLNKNRSSSKDSHINDNIERNVTESVDMNSVVCEFFRSPEDEVVGIPDISKTNDTTCHSEPMCVNVPLPELESSVLPDTSFNDLRDPSISPSPDVQRFEYSDKMPSPPSIDDMKVQNSVVVDEIATTSLERGFGSSDGGGNTDIYTLEIPADSKHLSQSETGEPCDSPIENEVIECDSLLDDSQSDAVSLKTPLVVVSHVEDLCQGYDTFPSLEDLLHSGVVPEYDGSTYDRYQFKMSDGNTVADDEGNNAEVDETDTDLTAYHSDSGFYDKAFRNQMDMGVILKNTDSESEIQSTNLE